MSGAYFVCMLAGFCWLALWSVRREPGRRNWLGFLFDMKGEGDEAAAATRPGAARRAGSGVASWRDRGRPGLSPGPADLHLPQRGATQPRRLRREQAFASRRRR